jgi:hypothetical protein
MMVNSGTYHHYQSPKTTHIIATNLPDVKVKVLKGNEIICHPNWITESLKAEKLLDFTQYLLYSNVNKSQPKLAFATSTKAKDAKDDNFLGDFYNNSRLHHISTIGANFKEYVNELRSKFEDGAGDFSKARMKLKATPGFNNNQNKARLKTIVTSLFFMNLFLDFNAYRHGLLLCVRWPSKLSSSCRKTCCRNSLQRPTRIRIKIK